MQKLFRSFITAQWHNVKWSFYRSIHKAKLWAGNSGLDLLLFMSQYKDSIDIFSQTSLLRVNRLYIHILLHPTPVPHVSKVVTKPPELFFVKTRMYFMRFSTCKQLYIQCICLEMAYITQKTAGRRGKQIEIWSQR